MDHWAMLHAFLTDSQQLDNYKFMPAMEPLNHSATTDPHPYSGISSGVIQMILETGTLVYQDRMTVSRTKFLASADLDAFTSSLQHARQLERRLLNYFPPQISHFHDSTCIQPHTCLSHLTLMDEAYRCAALAQLYRVFPDLLSERYGPWDKGKLLKAIPAMKDPTPVVCQAWLTSLALHTLDLFKAIPFESKTLSAQPFIMVAASSELYVDSSTNNSASNWLGSISSSWMTEASELGAIIK